MTITISASQEAILRQLTVRLNQLLKQERLSGQFTSLRSGIGVEAVGLDLFNPQAHDIRRVNWTKSDWDGDWYVNLYEPEIGAVAVGVFDLNPGEYFGTARSTKYDILCGTALAFSWFFSQQGNSFGSVIVGEDTPAMSIPRGNKLVSYNLFRELAETRTPDGERVQLGYGLKQVPAYYRKAEFAVVVSDFQSDDWKESLSQISHNRATVCIQPLDPWELELPDMGEIDLVDPVSGEQRTLVLSGRRGQQIRKEYAERAQARQESIADSIQAAHADHLVLRTDEDWIGQLMRHFRQQRYRPRR